MRAILPIVTALAACATTEAVAVSVTPAPSPSEVSSVQTPPISSSSTDALSVSSFGSPVVSSTPSSFLRPRWISDRRHGRVVCDGSTDRFLFSGQSPFEPSDAAIAHSFTMADRAVRACTPNVTSTGRLPVHGVFNGTGAPQEYTFPGVSLSESQALCVGRSLCALRLPTFRQVSAAVHYEYLVTDPAGTNP